MLAGKYRWFPHDIAKQTVDFLTNEPNANFDKLGRLIYTSAHQEISCPHQTQNTGVFVAFGQSNSANHAQHRFSKADLENVVNYFNGKCYLAQSPLLGATGDDGEWIALTARKLIDKGVYEKVVVVSSGIGGTSIQRWAAGNDLNDMFIKVLADVSQKYTVTDMIWHQGESDIKQTHKQVYHYYFKSLLQSIRETKVSAPIFMSVASICGAKENWHYPNQISKAQLELTKLAGVELGVNTDEALPINLRFDGCHFGKSAQEIAAGELANKIANHHN